MMLGGAVLSWIGGDEGYEAGKEGSELSLLQSSLGG